MNTKAKITWKHVFIILPVFLCIGYGLEYLIGPSRDALCGTIFGQYDSPSLRLVFFFFLFPIMTVLIRKLLRKRFLL
jgi:hypothetical protein